MSDGVEYTSDEIEELGTGPMNDLANYYDDIAGKTKSAGADRDSAFQDDGVGTPWNDLFSLLQDGLTESALNVRSLSQALIETAEMQRDVEWNTESELAELAGELESQYQTEVTEVAEGGAEPTPSENYSEAPEAPDYDEALNDE